MADEKISAMSALPNSGAYGYAGAVVVSGDVVPVVRNGVNTNFKAPVHDLTNVVKFVTLDGTGSTVLDPTEANIFAITTHGAGAAEKVTLGSFAPDHTYTRDSGRKVMVYMYNQENGSDKVNVYQGSYSSSYSAAYAGQQPGKRLVDLSTTYLSRNKDHLQFAWAKDYYWRVDVDGSQVSGSGVQFKPYAIAWQQAGDNQAGQAPHWSIKASGNAGAGKGGNMVLGAGDNTYSGSGGDVVITPGAPGGFGAGTAGHVLITTTAGGAVLPTADPHVVGALWNSGGTVHISAG